MKPLRRKVRCVMAKFLNWATKVNQMFFIFQKFVIFRFKSLVLLILAVTFLLGCSQPTTAKNERNQAALEQARQNIEKFRKGDAQIKIVGVKGKSLGNIKLNIKQISHNFKFGCYLKIDDLAPEKLSDYEKHFAKLFNFAVVGIYWDFVENKQGNEDWSWFEREVATANKLNLKIEAAPILWGTNQAGTPAWLPHDEKNLAPILKRRIESALTKSANIEDWEVVNEPLAPKKDFFAQNLGREYIEKAFLQARQIAPSKRLMLNEYGIFGAIESHNYNRDKYFALLNELIEKNVPIDIIGIQAHANGEWFEPANVAKQLERYATLGKPIQITEFSAQILDYDDRKTPHKISGAYQKGIWDAEKQAEFYREFYTISFGNPQVEAIVSWGLDDERAWLPGVGLIDATENIKPNYRMLDRLINNEWRTNLQIDLPANETAKFRGFYGNYEVEMIINGKKIKKMFELKKDAQNEWILFV